MLGVGVGGFPFHRRSPVRELRACSGLQEHGLLGVLPAAGDVAAVTRHRLASLCDCDCGAGGLRWRPWAADPEPENSPGPRHLHLGTCRFVRVWKRELSTPLFS